MGWEEAEPGKGKGAVPTEVLEDQPRVRTQLQLPSALSWCCPVHSVTQCNKFCFPSWMWLAERGLKCLKGPCTMFKWFKKANINVYLESGKQRSR